MNSLWIAPFVRPTMEQPTHGKVLWATYGLNEIPRMVVFIVSFTIASWGEWNWSERNKKPGSVPHSGTRTHICQTSTWVIPGLWNPSVVKMLICFRWRARIYVGGSCVWLLLKLYVNLQVTRLLNNSLDGVPVSSSQLGWHFLMSLAEIAFTSWHQFGGKRRKKRSWPAWDLFNCSV